MWGWGGVGVLALKTGPLVTLHGPTVFHVKMQCEGLVHSCPYNLWQVYVPQECLAIHSRWAARRQLSQTHGCPVQRG